jgi:Transposase
VDKWHLVALANSMVTEIRQRVTRDLLGRRVNRRLLLTGAEHLSAKQWNRLWRSFEVCDPTKEVQAGGRSRNASASSSGSESPGSSGGGWPTSLRPLSSNKSKEPAAATAT